jgi:hypothetical protein
MALTQLADIIEPQYFSDYFAENSMTSTALFQSEWEDISIRLIPPYAIAAYSGW